MRQMRRRIHASYHTHLPLFLCTTCNPLINVFSIKDLLAYASARVSCTTPPLINVFSMKDLL